MFFKDTDQKDSLKVVSWNVARRASKAALQVEAVMRFEADIVALQEVTVGSVGMIENAFQQSGLRYVAHTASLAENNQKRFCVLVASWRALHPPLIPGFRSILPQAAASLTHRE